MRWLEMETNLTNEQLASLAAKLEETIANEQREYIILDDMTGDPRLEQKWIEAPLTVEKDKYYQCEKCGAKYEKRFPARCAYCPAIFTPF